MGWRRRMRWWMAWRSDSRAFRWGFDEGARVTLASVALFAACGLGSTTEQDLPRLLLRHPRPPAFSFILSSRVVTIPGG